MKKRVQLIFAAVCAMALVAAFALVGCSSGGSSSAASSAASTASSSSAEASSSASDTATASASSESASAASSSASATADAVTLQIFAANSLEKALPDVQALYTEENPNVTFADTQFKGSGDLVEQLAGGASADLFIAASKSSMDKAETNGDVDAASRQDMFVNDLVLCTAEGSGVEVNDLADLASDEITSFAMGEPSAVPAGDYAAQSLSASGFCDYDADSKTITAWTDEAMGAKANAGNSSVGQVAQTVQSGDAQVGFVYSSDIYRYDGIESIYTVPADLHKNIVYPGAVCTTSSDATAAADFLDFCMNDPEAQRIFAEYGFQLAA